MSSDGARLKPWAVTPEKIAEAVRRLAAAAAPSRLIAFGSAATGDLSVANDLDLLVVEPQVPGTVEFAARTQGRVLYAGD